MKFMWMFVFMILPIIACAYLCWHIWAILPFHPLWKTVIVLVCLGCFLLLFLNLGRKFDGLPLPLAQWCYDIGTSSILVMLYLVMTFLLLDIGRLIHLVPQNWLYANGMSAMIIFLLTCSIFVYGNIRYHHKVRVPLELMSKKKLDKTYKVVMVSDLHLGYHNSRKDFAKWVDMMNAEQPDFILIAGDIIDGSMRPLREEAMADEFHRLQAPVYACLGNHEYYAGSPDARQFYRDAGIHLLIDEVAVIDSAIAIVGRDDRTNFRRKPLSELMNRNQTDGLYTIVLDHQPYDLYKTEKAHADFQFSGHTHRGQVWPISWITDAIYECSWGSHQRGSTRFYVSSGIGIWGGKYRIGTQSEYIVATIKKQH